MRIEELTAYLGKEVWIKWGVSEKICQQFGRLTEIGDDEIETPGFWLDGKWWIPADMFREISEKPFKRRFWVEANE